MTRRVDSLSGRRAREETRTEGGHARRSLFRGLGVGIDDFCCRAHVSLEGEDEPNPTHSIVFVRRGVFVRHDRDESLVADASQILFFNRNQPYRYAHPVAGGDDCTILMLEDDCVRAALARFAPRHADHPTKPFPSGHAQVTSRSARLHLELLATSRGRGSVPSIVHEDLVAELIDASLTALIRTEARRTRSRCSGSCARRRREAVEAAKLILNARVDSPPSLEGLAASVDLSPFHFSRVFRELTGLTLRRYLRRLRAALASDQLTRGARDLSRLASELGFCDHSHFTNSFRAEFGIPPSRLRRAFTSRRARSTEADRSDGYHLGPETRE